jgi:hypothetical protein
VSSTNAVGLQSLVESELADVCFVRDHLMLGFDGPTLQIFTWPTLGMPEGEVGIESEGYRDRLCAQIGKKISSVIDLPEGGVSLVMEDGVTININERDRLGPEIAVFRDKDGVWIW